ncbi:MAG: hypothetical protein ACYDDF_12980 [Thermoplasmatota archaeon]
MRRVLAFALASGSLLAGCIVPPKGSSAGTTGGIGGSESDFAIASTGDIVVVGNLSGSGRNVSVNASASNEGKAEHTVWGGCASPWSSAIETAGGTAVSTMAPEAQCFAVSIVPFSPHGRLWFSANWSGRSYNRTSGGWAEAPSGPYRWRIEFQFDNRTANATCAVTLRFNLS